MPRTQSSGFRIGIVIAIVILLIIGIFAYRYFTSYESTDDAQVDGHINSVSARVSGHVVKLNVQDNQYVQAGTQLMSIVPVEGAYVVANFKETQLTNVRSGQPVELQVDSFHATTLKGHVDSLSPASGLEFALLPPDNATGNFTKIVQRVPVKIVLDDHSLNGLLRPGMSAVPTIDTKSAVVAEGETARQVASHNPSPRS